MAEVTLASLLRCLGDGKSRIKRSLAEGPGYFPCFWTILDALFELSDPKP